MRKTLVLFMLLSVKLTFGQVSDEFSDGNFNDNPVWNGDVSKFEVNSSKQLQTSLTSISQSVSLVTPNFLAKNVKWQFTVQMNFDPSTTNKLRVYLITDQQDLSGPLNGYFVQIGESGSADSYDLYKQTGLTVVKIIDGLAKPRASANLLSARVSVTRDQFGKWELSTAIDNEISFLTEGSVTDLTHTSTAWFGVRCDYTATRSNGFIFDNFEISELIPDVDPPVLFIAKPGDVVINEIFADPTPQIGLPNAEYIELWNTTDQDILLKGWKYKDLTTTYTFTNDTLKANQFLILTATANASLFKKFGKTIGLSNWPSLNNEKDVLKISNQNGDLIDEVNYTSDWYKSNIKAQGGYALELIDPKNKCKGIQNWMASNAEIGGSPAEKNSVYQFQITTEPPKLLSATVIDDQNVSLQFNKYIDSLSASKLTNYLVNNGIGNPIMAMPVGPLFTTVNLKFASAFGKGIENLLTVNQLTDCAGNLIDALINTAKLFIAEKVKVGDLLISEILFNPRKTGADFVELYNNSSHVIDLSELKLANIDVNGSIANIKSVSAIPLFMPVNSYWVITTDINNIKEEYRVENINQMIELNSLPTYNNDKGTVVLLTDNFTVDRVDYTESMHLPLLKDVEGVSLERVSFKLQSNGLGNFKSAAQTVGFATPTSKNSQEKNIDLTKNEVFLAQKVFSPDGDGFDDELKINYRFLDLQQLVTVNIYTEKGILVRKLARNTSVGATGNFIWDGFDDAAKISKVGIYVIKVDAFTMSGKTTSFKQTCVLANRLN